MRRAVATLGPEGLGVQIDSPAGSETTVAAAVAPRPAEGS